MYLDSRPDRTLDWQFTKFLKTGSVCGTLTLSLTSVITLSSLILFTPIEEGTHHIDYLQITTPEVIPHGIRCEGLLRVLSWVSFDLPDHCKRTLSSLSRLLVMDALTCIWYHVMAEM